MLDVARHFFGVGDVCRLIDHIAAYKLNVLHLHLSDDQGWRLAIDSWPRLAEIGGGGAVGGGAGGFCTQNDYRAIVRHGGDRFVTVVPEIDAPGHVHAALCAHPELAGGRAAEPYTGIEVGFSSLDAHSELTYRFLDDVFGELAALTPGAFVPIGGDEALPEHGQPARSCPGTFGGAAGRAADHVARRPGLPRHEVRPGHAAGPGLGWARRVARQL